MHMNRLRIIAALFCAALLGCDKNAVQDLLVSPPAAAQVKFFNFGVGAPNVNFYANDTKVTAISSTVGSEATIRLMRDGREMTIKAKVAELPAQLQ